MLLALALLSPDAQAFCGTYVGGSGATQYANASTVAFYRVGNRTTLTVANDVSGDTDDFALVIPVPEILTEETVHVVDPSVFVRLDVYSQPRLVRYECEDFEVDSGWADTAFDSAGDGGDDTGGVTVEEQFIVGEYEIVILSAQESSGLLTWLNSSGYEVSYKTEEVLQTYIDAGLYFMAAKVTADSGVESGDVLSPLQLTYDTESFSLPIRIGTVNSPGEQDLIVYHMSPYAAGKVGISNYPEIEVEDECLWQPEGGQEFGEFYADKFTQAYEAQDEGAWVTEYAWGASGCDPCVGTPPDESDLATLGWTEEDRTVYDLYFTRIHMRYTPEQATSDVQFYQSGIDEQSQIRFIEYEDYLEELYPICGQGMADDPGSCDEGKRDGVGLFSGSGCSGCASSSPASGGGALLLFGLAGLMARRRR